MSRIRPNASWAAHCLAALAVWVALIAAPAATAAPAELTEHDGSRGVWLRTPAAEAFVAAEPRFRVLAFARAGQPSLMADANVAEQGVRLAFMGPDQVPPSFDVGNVPAEIVERTPSSVRVRLAPAAGLRYEVTLTLETERPRQRRRRRN